MRKQQPDWVDKLEKDVIKPKPYLQHIQKLRDLRRTGTWTKHSEDSLPLPKPSGPSVEHAVARPKLPKPGEKKSVNPK